MKPLLTAVSRWVVAAFVVSLAACETSIPQIQFPEITFTHLKPIRLDVVDVDFVHKYVPPQALPNVDHRFPQQPAAVAERWAKDRLEPIGISRRARVTLIDAAVTETVLKKREGVTGLFWTDQSERYEARVEMLVEVIDDDGNPQGHAQAVAQHSRTVPEGISLNDREQVWFEIAEDLMKDLDAELDKNIRRYLVRFVR